MKHFIFLSIFMMGIQQVQAYVENFALLDHEGRSHELYYYEKDKDTKLLVLYVHGNGCKVVRGQLSGLNKVKEKYEPKGVRFWMINSNPGDSREDVAKEAKKRKITWPILLDEAQLVAKTLELKHTAEVLVISPRDWSLVYRGAADTGFFEKALEAGLKGKMPKVASTESNGTAIEIEKIGKDSSSKISNSKVIAPLLLKKCVSCHQQGGI